MELLVSGDCADRRLEHDAALVARLPRTLAGLAAGLVNGDRADVIAARTMSLPDADAARADEVLAAAAPGLRFDQLARKAAALEMKLNPEAVKARKEHARQTRRRVEVRREDSGNASLAGRELDTADALASKAYIDAVAVRIRNSGLTHAVPALHPRPRHDRAPARPQPPEPDHPPAQAHLSPATRRSGRPRRPREPNPPPAGRRSTRRRDIGDNDGGPGDGDDRAMTAAPEGEAGEEPTAAGRPRPRRPRADHPDDLDDFDEPDPVD